MLQKIILYRLSFIITALLLLGIACNNPPTRPKNNQRIIPSNTQQADTFVIAKKSPIVLLFDSLGLVDIQSIDSSIFVELKYATTDNFTGKVLYTGLHQAYFQLDVAIKLSNAQQYLRKQHPEFRLLVYDAARPLHIQYALWESVKETPLSRYVANPEKTGPPMHILGF